MDVTAKLARFVTAVRYDQIPRKRFRPSGKQSSTASVSPLPAAARRTRNYAQRLRGRKALWRTPFFLDRDSDPLRCRLVLPMEPRLMRWILTTVLP